LCDIRYNASGNLENPVWFSCIYVRSVVEVANEVEPWDLVFLTVPTG